MALREIAGQERALRILYGMLKRERVPSAMLFSGDSGIGKRIAALNVAKALNCFDPVSDAYGIDSCDRCLSCRKIDAENHPDVIVVSPEEGELRIEAIRKVEELLSLTALEAQRRVVIIDDAEAMNNYAANAFLKTLEEPPADTLIILISSNPDGLPDTIKSRCTHVRFNPLPRETCREIISKNMSAADIDQIIGLSMGRPGLALSRDLDKEREWFLHLLQGMVKGEKKEIWEDKDEMRLWLESCLVLLRDLVVFSITGKEGDLIFGRGKRLKATTDVHAFTSLFQTLQGVKALLDFNLNKSITWNYVAARVKKCIQ